MEQASFLRCTILMFIGPIVWAFHFLLIYGLTGIVCARPAMQQDWPGIVAWGIGVATATAIGGIAIIHFRHWLERRSPAGSSFIEWISSSLALLSVVAIVWEALPVLFVSPCG
jgi:uncharacterized membrane protein